MRVGLMIPPQTPAERIVPIAVRAEDLGYDFIACGEHIFFHAPVTNAFIALAAAAGATTRIRLLSAVTLLPTYASAVATKMVATLDLVSGGRFELGVGVGGEYPAEMWACGVNPSERGARTDEALHIMRRVFGGERLKFKGRFARYDGVALDPLPHRSGPPVWIGGRREPSLRRAGQYGDVWMPYMVDPEQFRAGIDSIARFATDYERAAPRGALFSWAGIGRDPNAARREALASLQGLYNQDFSSLATRYIPTGTPTQVARRLAEFAEAGADNVIFAPACDADSFDQTAEIFARDVAPALAATSETQEMEQPC